MARTAYRSQQRNDSDGRRKRCQFTVDDNKAGSGDLWQVAVFPSMLFLLCHGIELLPKV